MGGSRGGQVANSVEFLDGQSQGGLQMDNQKGRSIRTANGPGASEDYSSSLPIRAIRG